MREPQVDDAKELAKRLGAQGVIVLAFDGEMVASASYGQTKGDCRTMCETLDVIVDGITDGNIPVRWPTRNPNQGD